MGAIVVPIGLFLAIVEMILVVLKLCGIVMWSWWVVLIPGWILVVVILLIVVLFFILANSRP